MRSIVVWSALALTIFLPLLAQAEYSSAHSTKLATVPNEFLLRYSSKRFSALDKLQIEQRLGVSTVRTHPLTNTALVVGANIWAGNRR